MTLLEARQTRAVEDAHRRYRSEQVLVVWPLSAGGTHGLLSAFEFDSGGWRRVAGPLMAALGRNGVADDKSEGDGRTPLGSFRISEAFGLADDPGSALPFTKLRGDEVWVNDPGSPLYNTLQHDSVSPDWRSAERLSANPDAYEWAAVIDYNRSPAVPGLGSAIFLHVELGHPTSGCVAVGRGELLEILRWLRPEAAPAIVITV